MKYLIVLLLVANGFCSDHLQKMNNDLNKKLDKIEAEKTTKTKDAIKGHLINLEKLKIYYTKQGNLEKALEVKAAIENLSPKPFKWENSRWRFVGARTNSLTFLPGGKLHESHRQHSKSIKANWIFKDGKIKIWPSKVKPDGLIFEVIDGKTLKSSHGTLKKLN